MAGRPTDYDPKYCSVVIDQGKLGKSVVQMACHVGVVKQTLYDWAEVHPEFMDAFTRARQLSQYWWEETAQKHMVEMQYGPKINSGLWSRSMAARFPDDYREKQTIEHAGKIETTAPVLNIFTTPKSESE